MEGLLLVELQRRRGWGHLRLLLCWGWGWLHLLLLVLVLLLLLLLLAKDILPHLGKLLLEMLFEPPFLLS